MSLINDALRKAQTDVDRGPVNPMAGSLAGAHVRHEKRSPYMKLGVIAMLLGASVWAVSLFMGNSEDPKPVAEVASMTTVAQASPAEAARVDAVPAQVAPPVEPVVETTVSTTAPAEPIAEVSAQVESAPIVQPEPEPIVAEPAEIAPAVQQPPVAQQQVVEVAVSAPVVTPEVAPESTPTESAPLEATPPATPPAAVVETPKPVSNQALKDEITYTLKQLEVTAVMGDGSKARIMSGGQIHRAGELINLDLKIRFQGKKGKTLYFSDPNGEIYEKSL